MPARETPGGTAQHSLPRSPELSAAAGSALHRSLIAPAQRSTASARSPTQKRHIKLIHQASHWGRSSWRFLRQICWHVVHESCICWGEYCKAEHSKWLAWSDNQVGTHAAFLCVTSSSQRVQVMFCPFQQPFLNNYKSCHLCMLGQARLCFTSHLFELIAQYDERIHGGLHLS